ncbi:hypothetical protein AMK59_3389, partial [Oryctes borbonicus]
MATSLAEQLQRLAVPQTNPLKQDKKRASFLFDEKQAAEISREAFYQIGVEGFEELKLKCPIFTPFQNTLFHATSKQFERSIQNTTANERLNRQIRKFMILLSPYLSLTCAHKALEWLIYRYHVHEYNKKDFLMLILPYHEANIFIRALQLIRIKDINDDFLWLKKTQRAGVHLPKSVLYQYAAKNPHFLREIGEFVVEAIKEHNQPHNASILINLYCMIVTGALEYSVEVNETHITQILSIVLKGQRSSIGDFCAGCYIITAKILSKTKLTAKLLNKCVDNISLFPVEHLRTEAVFLLAILYQTQTQFSEMSEFAVKNCANSLWITKILGRLNCTKNFLNPLLTVLFRRVIECGLVEQERNEVHQFVFALLNDIQLEDSFVSQLISIIVEGYVANRKNVNEDVQQWLKNIMSIIETQYPQTFDKEVSRILKIDPNGKMSKTEKCLRKLIVNCEDVEKNVDLFHKLYHPVPGIRRATIKHYIKTYTNLKDREQEFLRNLVLTKLNDEDPDVVCEILNRSKKLLPQIIETTILTDILIKLLKKGERSKWHQIIYPTLSILCSMSNENNTKVFIAILPFLLPVKHADMNKALLIVNSYYFANSKYFKTCDPEILKKTTDYTTFFDIICNSFESLRLNINELAEILKNNLDRNESIISKYIVGILVCQMLPENVSSDISLLVLKLLDASIDKSVISETKTDGKMRNYLLLLKQHKLPIECMFHCVDILIKKTEIPLQNLESCDLSGMSITKTFFIPLINILMSGACTNANDGAVLYARALKHFLNRFFSNLQSKIIFLLNISFTTSTDITESLRLRSIRIVNALINATTKKSSFTEPTTIVAYLLIAMSNKCKEIRTAIMIIVHSILANSSVTFEPDYNILLKNILDCKEEIILDDRQISVIMSTLQIERVRLLVTNLVKLVNNKRYSLYLRECLANILVSIEDAEVYDNLSEFAIELLNEKKEGVLDEQTSIFLYSILTSLNADNVSETFFNSIRYKMVETALRADSLTIKFANINMTLSILCIQHIQHVYSNFTNDAQTVVLNNIVELATTTLNSDVVVAVRKLFKHLDLDANLIMQQLSTMHDILQPRIDTIKKKRRVSRVPTIDILESLEWKKGIVALECLQDKKKIRNPESLIPFVFNILKKCLEFDEQSNVEYPKQLLLSTLLNCCTKLEQEHLPESLLNVEVLVQCIRTSPNPQTHHHALLVLAYTANFAPKQVLHHMISIFTFVGSSMLRHDDAYSFQIITKIIDTIIPILVDDNSLAGIVHVIRVFVDAVPDVPEHRRMTLYQNLLEKLGANDSLYLFVLLMLEVDILDSEKEKDKTNKTKSASIIKRSDIAADICRKFAANIVIETCVKLISFLQKLPERINDIAKIDLPLDITHYTSKQYRHYKYAIITYIPSLLSSPEFISIIVSLSRENQQRLEVVYKSMIISTLSYIQAIAKIADRTNDTSQSRYWKTILHHSYDTLDSINGLLTPSMFLLVVQGLTTHSLENIRRRSLELLNTKLQDLEFFRDCTEVEVCAMIPSLLNVIRQGEKDENQVTVQTAFLSLKLFIRLFAKQNVEKFVDVLNYLVSFIKIYKVQGNVLASAVLCLAELCDHLKAHSISNLSKFMPMLIKILKVNREHEYPDLLILSTITAVLKILESLPLFLSSYLESLLYEISFMSSKWKKSNDGKLKTIIGKLEHVKEKIALLIPARTLFPAISKTYNQLVEDKNYRCIGPLMNVLTEKLFHLSTYEVQANTLDLTTSFLNALRFRSDQLTPFLETNEIEKEIINAATNFILKLSESAFRPLYYKIYDWAVRQETNGERLITFYALSSNVADCLKNLFVLFAGHILNNAALVLDSCNIIKQQESYCKDEEKSLYLLELVLKTLHTVFLYDNGKFLNKEKFDLLMQPIIDQLENTLGGQDVFISRAENLVIPCIIHFGIASCDDTYWKQLNYQILLKMRHSSSTIRILALKCVLQFANKLGTDFLPLLPETIPFLAELFEDENQDVERTCQKTVQELEKILGEPL